MKIRVGRKERCFPALGLLSRKKAYIQIISEFLTTSLIMPENGKVCGN
jgi:hypothetical protein